MATQVSKKLVDSLRGDTLEGIVEKDKTYFKYSEKVVVILPLKRRENGTVTRPQRLKR